MNIKVSEELRVKWAAETDIREMVRVYRTRLSACESLRTMLYRAVC